MNVCCMGDDAFVSCLVPDLVPNEERGWNHMNQSAFTGVDDYLREVSRGRTDKV